MSENCSCKCNGIANTVLLVLILIAIVAFGVLSMKGQGNPGQAPGQQDMEPPAQTELEE